MENLFRIKNGRGLRNRSQKREEKERTTACLLISYITQYIQIPIVHKWTHFMQTFPFVLQSTSIEEKKKRLVGRDSRLSHNIVSANSVERFPPRHAKRSDSLSARILHITTVGPWTCTPACDITCRPRAYCIRNIRSFDARDKDLFDGSFRFYLKF